MTDEECYKDFNKRAEDPKCFDWPGRVVQGAYRHMKASGMLAGESLDPALLEELEGLRGIANSAAEHWNDLQVRLTADGGEAIQNTGGLDEAVEAMGAEIVSTRAAVTSLGEQLDELHQAQASVLTIPEDADKETYRAAYDLLVERGFEFPPATATAGQDPTTADSEPTAEQDLSSE